MTERTDTATKAPNDDTRHGPGGKAGLETTTQPAATATENRDGGAGQLAPCPEGMSRAPGDDTCRDIKDKAGVGVEPKDPAPAS